MVGQFRHPLGLDDDWTPTVWDSRHPGGHAVTKQAASTSQMGRFETLLASERTNSAWIEG